MLASIFAKNLKQKWIFTFMDTCQKITEEETFYILLPTYYTTNRNKEQKRKCMFSHSTHKLRPHEQQKILSWEKSIDGVIILLLILKCFAHFHSNLFSTKTSKVESVWLCFGGLHSLDK